MFVIDSCILCRNIDLKTSEWLRSSSLWVLNVFPSQMISISPSSGFCLMNVDIDLRYIWDLILYGVSLIGVRKITTRLITKALFVDSLHVFSAFFLVLA